MKIETLKQAKLLSTHLSDLDDRIEKQKEKRKQIAVSQPKSYNGFTRCMIEYSVDTWMGHRTETHVMWLSFKLILEDFDHTISQLEKEREELLIDIENLNC